MLKSSWLFRDMQKGAGSGVEEIKKSLWVRTFWKNAFGSLIFFQFTGAVRTKRQPWPCLVSCTFT
eukprot:4414486-Karenia_brevis.AAC.1